MGVDGVQIMSRLGKSYGSVSWIFMHWFQSPGGSLPRRWRTGEKMDIFTGKLGDLFGGEYRQVMDSNIMYFLCYLIYHIGQKTHK